MVCTSKYLMFPFQDVVIFYFLHLQSTHIPIALLIKPFNNNSDYFTQFYIDLDLPEDNCLFWIYVTPDPPEYIDLQAPGFHHHVDDTADVDDIVSDSITLDQIHHHFYQHSIDQSVREQEIVVLTDSSTYSFSIYSRQSLKSISSRNCHW